MHWGVAFITACAGVYATMMGSLLDDQVGHSQDYRYTDEATVQSVLKHTWYD